jgi:glycosyltransferase 2 family protein
LAGAISFLPGGLGSTEAVMTTLLAAHGFSLADSIFMTLACRLLTLWLAVVLGWIAVLVLRQRSLAPAVPWQ